MSRPMKRRRICRVPQVREFRPAGEEGDQKPVILTIDEWETVRLIDREGLSQEQCSACMQIARTTVQKIYESARRKIAMMLVDGCGLRIEGGDYRLCDGRDAHCGMENCHRRQIAEMPKEAGILRIAVAWESGNVFAHFGRAAQFKLYDVREGRIAAEEIVAAGGGHGAQAELLGALRADAVICGGIGAGARAALEDVGIALYGGVSGPADDAVRALLENRLDAGSEVSCGCDGGNCGC